MADKERSKAWLSEGLAELKKPEGIWHSLAANAPIFIAVADRDGVIRFLNRVQPGHSFEESVGKRIYDFIEPDYHDQAKACLERVFSSGEATSYETVGAGPTGKSVWYETHLGPVKHGSEVVGVSLFSADISTRKEVEAALQEARDTLERRVEERTSEVVDANRQLQQEVDRRRQSEDRYRLLVETTNDLIWELDQTGAYTYMSPRAKELLGYDPEELIGRTPFEFMPPDEAQRLQALFDEYLASGQGNIRLEVARLHKDGRPLVHETNVSPVFDESGACCGFRGISRDVTERREAERSLQQHHEELQAIYDGMLDGVLIADIETKRFIRANVAICRMLGYSQEETLSLTVMDIHPPDDLAGVLEVFQAQAEGRVTIAESIPMLCKDGSVFYADITANHLVYQGRRCNIGFFRDITERRKSEAALQKEHRTLNRLLKAQDQERQIIAYEIHDGLAQQLAGAIMHFQAFEQGKHQVPEELSGVCNTIQGLLAESLAEARRLINGVRPPILDEHGIVSAIEFLVAENVDHAKMEISFQSEIQRDRLEPVLENAIYRIIQESLSNACRHSEASRVQIELVQHDEKVRIVVQDWGIGFDPQSVDEQCFGLAGIRERARLLGGVVSIDASPGEGSRIIVELPIVAGGSDSYIDPTE